MHAVINCWDHITDVLKFIEIIFFLFFFVVVAYGAVEAKKWTKTVHTTKYEPRVQSEFRIENLTTKKIIEKKLQTGEFFIEEKRKEKNNSNLTFFVRIVLRKPKKPSRN